MIRFISGLIAGTVLGAVAWHITHITLIGWIIGVTTSLLVWFGAPIFGAVADAADDIL